MRASVGSVATLFAVACSAYLVADLAHEAFGHAGACLALGGKSLLLSTTYEACSIRSRLIDGAGPLAGIAAALLAWTWLRLAPPKAIAARAFLCLTFAFAIFWNVGYLIKSGLTDQGDWAFVIAGLEPRLAWHIGLTVLGIILYGASMRLLGTAVVRNFPADGEQGMRPLFFALTAYLAAGLLSAAAAFFDPRGASTILTDALPSSLGSIGLVWVGYFLNKRRPDLRIPIRLAPGWILAGLVCTAFFVAILGPGLRS
jgi:hypothetical protein